jgi:hypothetical protein
MRSDMSTDDVDPEHAVLCQILLPSYAQCSKACRCFLRQLACPLTQFFLICAACLRIAFHLLICRSSSGPRLPW